MTSSSESAPAFTRSDNAYSRSRNRDFSSSVSNVPQDVSDEDALSGAWQRSKIPPKSAQQLDMERIWELRRDIGNKIRLTNKLEQEVVYYQKQLKELKQSLLYGVEHLDKEIVDYGIEIAVESHKVRKAKVLLDRWLKEASNSLVIITILLHPLSPWYH